MNRVSCFALVLVAIAGCATEPTGDSASAVAEDSIVGGTLEPNRFPAAGYLVFRLSKGPHAGEIFRPDCGATLIAPRAVVTAVHCVEEASSGDATVVAVGFGDGLTGPTFPVKGNWQQWVHPDGMVEENGRPTGVNPVYDVAVVELASDVPGISPMPTVREPVAAGTPAVVIGYGRVVAGAHEPFDEITLRPDHRDRYPGLRKAAELELVDMGDEDWLFARPKPGTTGGICKADSGSALLVDGTIAGVLSVNPSRGCREDGLGAWARLDVEPNAAFVADRIRQIAGGSP